MSRNIVKPKSVSFEEALRNLASRLTGCPAADLPRTQEGIVQYMAENVPAPSGGNINTDELAEAITKEVLARIKLDELGEAVTKEVLARLAESTGAIKAATEPAEEPQDGAEAAGGTSTPPAAEEPQEAAQTATEGTKKPKSTRKSKTDK
jgi:hypothetical protein